MQSLYIHIPFCSRKCLYCSFVVFVEQEKYINKYIACLNKESENYKNKKIHSLYFGGGTPSLLNISQLDLLFSIIHKNFNIELNAEISFEANPNDLSIDKLKFLKGCGVNRLSVGVQSLNNKSLKILSRSHTKDDFLRSFSNIRNSGFDNVNLDFIYGLPGQTLNDVLKDINDFVALNTEHLSLYSLTIEKNSRFYVDNFSLLSDIKQVDYYSNVLSFLEDNNFIQYEISNFSKNGFESKHNVNYWSGGNYIGLGVGAHSHFEGKRSWNVSLLRKYIDQIDGTGLAVEGQEILDKNQRLIETLLFGLRMNDGVVIAELEKRFNCCLSKEKMIKINEFITGGFLELKKDRLQATLKGRLVLDNICADLV